MAAICGVFYKDGVNPELKLEINSMLSRQTLFDDDVSDSYCLSNIAFAQVLSQKNQNFSDSRALKILYERTNKLLICQYARFDNKEELIKLLDVDNSISEQQLVLQLYKKFGKNFAKYILGDFAIALWDGVRNTLFCVSDIMNCRPIFYFSNNVVFAFATEINALLTLPIIKREPDLVKIANLCLDETYYIDEECRSYIKNIRYLPGASILEVKKHFIKKEVYWTPNITKNIYYSSEDDYFEEFKHLLNQAIIARTKVTSQIGAMLSGGLDSSAIVVTICNLFKSQNRKLETFSHVLPLNHDNAIADERKYIELFKIDNLTINYIDSHLDGPFDNLGNILAILGCPDYIAQQYIYATVSNKLKEKRIRVLIDGSYGEIGPTMHDDAFLSRQFLTFHWYKLVREAKLGANLCNRPFMSFLFRRVISPLIPAWLRCILNEDYRELYNSSGLILNKKFVSHYSDIPEHILRYPFLHEYVLNRKKTQLQFMKYKQDRHPSFCYTDKSGIETLYPYLDRRILEFCLNVPDDVHAHNGHIRYLMRRSMRGIMPEAICNRLTKMPFDPGYMQRYCDSKEKLLTISDEISSNNLAREIIDFTKLKELIPNNTPDKMTESALYTIPTTIGLGIFLNNFPN